MKSVYTCSVFFILLIGLITANTLYLRSFFNKTDSLLDELPEKIQQLENMSDYEQEKYTSILDDAIDGWNKKERYMTIVLNHQTAGQIPDKLMPAREYFKAKDYESYLASLSEAKLLLKRMKENESLNLDTIF